WAALSINSAVTSSLDLPVSRLPSPSAALPAIPAPRPASFALRATPPRLISDTPTSSLTVGGSPQRSCNIRFQHEHRGWRDHCRATIELALTSNSNVVSSVGG